ALLYFSYLPFLLLDHFPYSHPEGLAVTSIALALALEAAPSPVADEVGSTDGWPIHRVDGGPLGDLDMTSAQTGDDPGSTAWRVLGWSEPFPDTDCCELRTEGQTKLPGHPA